MESKFVTRRSALLWGAANTALAARGASAALAQADPPLGGQAEWRQGYESASRLRVVRSTTPLLSPQTFAGTEQAIERYRDIAGRDGFLPVTSASGLKVGARGRQVASLRQRLVQSGDLDATGGAGAADVYDDFVAAGVRRFQTRHGLNATGQVNDYTLRAFNVPVETRLRQLETNIVRLRSMAQGNLGARYITTNIPAAHIETVEDGVVQTRHTAVVGKSDRQSPILSTRVSEINFHPFWTTPSSIIRKDLIPKMRTEPNYLTENRIRILNASGQEVAPSSVNWNSNEAMQYRFRQDPGDFNSMGTVRINIPNTHGVYMHDTNSKGLFGDEQRFHSSGCIRVQNVRDYVAWILKNTPGMTREAVEEGFSSGKRLDVKVADSVPVYWIYMTAWSGPDGVVQFRDDIYGKDGLGSVPVASASRRAPDPDIVDGPDPDED